jgi:hypothetical protein
MTLRLWLDRMWRLLLLAAGIAFLTWVWPTRYRYDHVLTDGNAYPVRIDRFNGDADMLVPDEGWTPVEGDSGGPGDNQTTGARRPHAKSAGRPTS